ncbi:GGDEF domain-containing protein [Psychrosphaera sp. 1_MG-2023]|uniref:GGDEF domain-containing protein n=1 Tax=Psychrosphaera sp. 1_MG-2023 TaxID=3062643 RepID=UPI0026E37B25|nr:GGDEF domain-containing protein [Psychrosphaera sp. 1_MG-2023]MDO6717767.1 GGDEF domain-containing protein [Psychrosphaera sp. 1_MG-2023]
MDVVKSRWAVIFYLAVCLFSNTANALSPIECNNKDAFLQEVYSSIELLNVTDLKNKTRILSALCFDQSHFTFTKLAIADAEDDGRSIVELRDKIANQHLLNKNNPYFHWQLFTVLQSHYWDVDYQVAIETLSKLNVYLNPIANTEIEVRLFVLIGNLYWNAETELQLEHQAYYKEALRFAQQQGNKELLAYVLYHIGDSIPLRNVDSDREFLAKKRQWLQLINNMPSSVTKADVQLLLGTANVGNTAQSNIRFVENSIELFDMFGVRRSSISARVSLAELLFEYGLYDNTVAVINDLLTEKILTGLDKSRLYKFLFLISKNQNNFEQAIVWQEYYYESILEQSLPEESLDMLLANYKVAEQKNKAMLLEQTLKVSELKIENNKQHMVNLFLLVGLLIVGLSFVLFMYQKNHKSKLKYEKLATTDTLTGEKNRYSILQCGEREVDVSKRTGIPMTVALADIDDFKKINDQYGHDIGDEALKLFADASKSAVRSIDYFGRYGGEEWLFILPNTTEAEANALFKRISVKLSNSRQEHGLNHMTFSMGAVDLHGGHNTLEQLIKIADERLYTAKNNGKNQVCVNPTDQVLNVTLSNA